LERPSAYINGKWLKGDGPQIESVDPSTGARLWLGSQAGKDLVDQAVNEARKAFKKWSLLLFDERFHILERFREILLMERETLAETISREVGKPKWESLSEVDAMAAKVDISKEAFLDRCKEIQIQSDQFRAITRFRPHGVVSVFGPYNFPGHLPNGHIVPALLAGNTVIFKPSENAPLVGEMTVEFWERAGLPPGALNLLQGAAETGRRLSEREDVNGLFFTGSVETGRAIHRAHGGTPEKILALEMGGNNPALVFNLNEPYAAARAIAQSAFISSGQRCTCARRLIIPDGKEGDTYLEALLAVTSDIIYGFWDDEPEPFMGPLVSERAAQAVIKAGDDLLSRGGESLLDIQRRPRRSTLLAPRIIDVTRVPQRPDTEIFGPLLQVIRAPDFEAALIEANNTSYGLSAGLFSDDRALWDRFISGISAGIVNWNRPLTGASSQMPFGGIKASGNHRPAAYFSADYCSYPLASMESEKVSPTPNPPGFPPL
jgi:succinylglutamic semialdehyde dehydrogenase